jgi:hypothetical protein
MMEIVSPGYPDPTQFDRKHEHYDAGAKREEPRWLLVDVKFRRKFAKPVLLDALREQEAKFKGLRILERGSRLSVTPVATPHWKAILKLAGEKDALRGKAAALAAAHPAVGFDSRPQEQLVRRVVGLLEVRIAERVKRALELRALSCRHLQPAQHATVGRPVVAVMEQRDVPAPADRVEEVHQRARSFRELETVEVLVGQAGHASADHEPHVHLGHLVAGHVDHCESVAAQVGDDRLALDVSFGQLDAGEHMRRRRRRISVIELGDDASADLAQELAEAAGFLGDRHRQQAFGLVAQFGALGDMP